MLPKYLHEHNVFTPAHGWVKWRENYNYAENLQSNCCLKFDFQKVDQHAGGKWLIHDIKRRKDNQLQSLKLPCRISKLSS